MICGLYAHDNQCLLSMNSSQFHEKGSVNNHKKNSDKSGDDVQALGGLLCLFWPGH